MSKNWIVEQTHMLCAACEDAAKNAVAYAQCTGSVEATYSDNGNHDANNREEN